MSNETPDTTGVGVSLPDLTANECGAALDGLIGVATVTGRRPALGGHRYDVDLYDLTIAGAHQALTRVHMHMDAVAQGDDEEQGYAVDEVPAEAPPYVPAERLALELEEERRRRLVVERENSELRAQVRDEQQRVAAGESRISHLEESVRIKNDRIRALEAEAALPVEGEA